MGRTTNKHFRLSGIPGRSIRGPVCGDCGAPWRPVCTTKGCPGREVPLSMEAADEEPEEETRVFAAAPKWWKTRDERDRGEGRPREKPKADREEWDEAE